ncbi:zinc carboxypeptidase [Lasallia pustulata]|uniref:Inactive metallocarboxypeptidase ECM14 n=1 Tax=Lasallia pustulata TaxID=136370 RepID=A0A1W5D0W4_9LECA|nr:zinc carboxypeptidase [Lasallia pustulata]
MPQLPQQSFDNKRLWTRLRDGIIQTVWGPPPPSKAKSTRPCTSSTSPPSTLLARYGGDVVLRFKIQTAEEAQALAEATHVLFLDVWEFNNEWVDIRLSKDVVPSLLGLLPPSLQRAHTPLMHDLAQTIFESYPSPTLHALSPSSREDHRAFTPDLRTSPDETNIFFRNYQPLSVIVPWMRLLQSLFPTHVRMINIGISYEGRDIPALRIGVHPTNSEKPLGPRKTVIIMGGSHAREWISTSTVNYVAYSLITAYGKSKSMTKLVEQIDWIFIPTINPDGYVYTWENDRLWRKNRQQTNLRFCRGVDLDRTYGFEWDGHSSRNNPCSESYSGEGPLQGVESRRFMDWMKNETESNNANIIGFLDFHSYSQQVLYPYSYSCSSTPPSLENLEELAIGLAKAIRISSGQIYGVTSACEGSVTDKSKGNKNREVYPRIESGGGSALDWLYHEMRVRYAYQIKLRDTGSYGFLLPAENIVPTGKEAFNAAMYFGKYLLGQKGFELEEDLIRPETGHRGASSGNTTPVSLEVKLPAEEEPHDQDGPDSEESAEEVNLVDAELRRRRR